MDRPFARRLLFAALLLGLTAEVLLDGPAFGLNVPLLVGATLAAGWLLRRRGRAPDPLDAWLPVAALALAAFVAVRADPFLALVDAAGAAVFAGASMAAFSGLAVTRRSAAVVITMAAWGVEALVAGAARTLRVARPPRSELAESRPAWLGAVGRGLLLAIPLVLIFAVLFASADPIFRRGLDDLLGFSLDLGDLPGRLLFVLGATWLVAGLLSLAAVGLPELERSSLGAAARTPAIAATRERFLGATEAIVILVAVDLVVLAFVGLQLAYLFGGLDTLAAAGMTYSDYARRGFFELVAAAALAGGLLMALELAIRTRPRAYVLLATGLVALTLVVLASAALRLQLYQDAYGWTELRLYVDASIAAMAVTLVVMAVLLLRDRMGWLGHAMAVIAVVTVVGLDLVAPAAFVAERNLDRAIDPGLVPPDGFVGLDVDYLAQLPNDAVPAMVEALPQLAPTDAANVRAILEQRRLSLADPAFQGPAAWNLGRERARAALAALD